MPKEVRSSKEVLQSIFSGVDTKKKSQDQPAPLKIDLRSVPEEKSASWKIGGIVQPQKAAQPTSQPTPQPSPPQMPQEKVKELETIKVEDLMSTRFIVLHPKTTLREALKVFAERGISEAPVVEDGEFRGILTNQDIIYTFEQKSIELGQYRYGEKDYHREFHKLGDKKVGDLIKKRVSVMPKTNIFDTMIIMDENNADVVPVVNEEGLLVGLVKDEDVVKAFLRSLV